MRMPPLHFLRDSRGDILKPEMPGFLRHSGMEHDLQQQIAEFVFQGRHVVPLDRIGDLVGLLDRIRRDRRESFVPGPRDSHFPIAQPGHNGQQTIDRAGRHAANIAWRGMPGAAPRAILLAHNIYYGK